MLAPKKIALFVCNDLMGLLLLNRIIPGMKHMGYQPVIFNTGENHNRHFKIPTPAIVKFFNVFLPTKIITPILEQYSLNDSTNHSYLQLARMHDVEYREIDNVNDLSLIEEILKDDQYLGGIAARFLQVLEKEIINAFHRKGFLWNLHSGLLPDYKGLLTPFRAIMNEEQTYGMTLHDLTCGIDEGDIILKGVLPLDSSKPVLDLYLDMIPTGADMILKTLSVYQRDGSVSYMPQEKTIDQSYYTNPTDKELRDFMLRNIIYADPQNIVERLANLFSLEKTLLREQLRLELGEAISGVSGSGPSIQTLKTATNH